MTYHVRAAGPTPVAGGPGENVFCQRFSYTSGSWHNIESPSETRAVIHIITRFIAFSWNAVEYGPRSYYLVNNAIKTQYLFAERSRQFAQFCTFIR